MHTVPPSNDEVLAPNAGNLKAWQGTLGDIHATIAAILREQGHTAEQVSRLSGQLAMALCTTLGGRVVYLPRGESVRRAIRDVQLFTDWREQAQSIASLAAKYRLSVQTVYDIISKQRKAAGKHADSEPFAARTS
jgi:Mor family transcriptional regulator